MTKQGHAKATFSMITARDSRKVVTLLCSVSLNFLRTTGTVGSQICSDFFNVYLHRNASIVDTRLCAENYMYVINPAQFRRMKFEFKCLTDVENYWTELQNVCTRTPLNRRSYMSDDHVSAVDYEDPEFDSGEFN